MATGIDAAVSPIMASLQTGLDALRAGEPIFGAVRLAEVFTELLAQLPSAMAVFSNECKQAAAATIDKRKPPRISIAPPALVISPVQEPPAEPPMTIVLTKPCRWKVPVEGTMEVAQRGDLVSWPESRAKRAIELGAAVLPGTEIAKMHQTARMGRTYPDPTMTVDLDTGFLPPGLGGPPLVDEPVNIRAHEKPRTVIIPRAEINQMQRGADEPPDGAA